MIISIIGSGNMAHHLAMAFENDNIQIESIYSKTSKNATKLAAKLYDTAVQKSLDFSDSESNIFIICVSDSAIEEVANAIILPDNSLLLHTSGSMPLSILNVAKKNNFIETGVFYPLMTLSKDVALDFSSIPICIESEDKKSVDALMYLGKKLTKKIYTINSKERKTLHLAAIFASNFTNHLWAISKEIVDEEGIDFEILKPIIKETLRKAMEAEHPADVQTGPAVRMDQTTIDSHLKSLKEDKDLQNVYKTLSNSIKDWHHGE
jgi:predicted short-subunit dehydrogenase-like oxidoreductase (DUF2520 family)